MRTIYGFLAIRQNFSWGIFIHIWVFVYSFSQLRKNKFGKLRNFSYICISENLFITPNDIYESK